MMKALLTIFFWGAVFTINGQTYMYIEEGVISPESPVSTTDVVSIQLTGNFSDTGAGVDDYSVSLDGTTVNLVINASSPGGATSLVPFSLTYELGMYDAGEYTVEISGSGIGVSIEDPLTFVVEGGGTGSIPDPDAGFDFVLYPNPAADQLILSFEKWQNGMEAQLISISGKIIQNRLINGGLTKIDVSAVDQGVYFVRIVDAEGAALKTRKIAVTR